MRRWAKCSASAAVKLAATQKAETKGMPMLPWSDADDAAPGDRGSTRGYRQSNPSANSTGISEAAPLAPLFVASGSDVSEVAVAENAVVAAR